MAQYVGILDGAGDVWGVRIPDFPGCYGGGPTAEAALGDAINALREVAAHYVANGRSVPVPRTMDQIRRDEDAAYDPGSESMVMVPLLLDKARPVRANISIDAGTLEAIDEEAEKRGLTRSGFLASAAMEKITGRFGGLPTEKVGRTVARTFESGSFKSGSQVKNTLRGAWTIRDDKSGKFMDVKTDPKPRHDRGATVMRQSKPKSRQR